MSQLTVNKIVQWGGIVFTAGSLLVASVGYCYSLKGDIQQLRQEVETLVRDNAQQHAQYDREIDRLKTHTDTTDHTVSDLSAKLDVAVTILTRIDKKMNQP
jgi:hypothetical protein